MLCESEKRRSGRHALNLPATGVLCNAWTEQYWARKGTHEQEFAEVLGQPVPQSPEGSEYLNVVTIQKSCMCSLF